MRYLYLFVCFLTVSTLSAQRVLLIEKLNSAHTTKLYVGDYIQYQLVGEKDWYGERIYDLRDDTQALVFPDRYVAIEDIAMLRQGKPWARNIGMMLITFGVSWSGFALLGTATDGDPETGYRSSDAIVTGVAAGTGLLLPVLFGTRRLRFGEGHRLRLRILDISF
ncbi:MAG: hypothetical protein ACRBG0_06760 [Lewinella sp.]|uniref:hypothetical protein n=1 Tax=Lewinella TaxID=70994 RepID=UPI000376C9EF|nr:hypothetical protein [Lewinella cohaerens]